MVGPLGHCEVCQSESCTFDRKFKVGMVVQLHPATDEWMRGAQTGVIKIIEQPSGIIGVKLPGYRSTRRFKPDYIMCPTL